MAYQDTTVRELEIKSILQFESGFDKWICIWEHEYNEKEKEFHEFLGSDTVYNLVDKLSQRDSVKGGRTEVFKMYCRVENWQSERIR